MPRCKVGDMAKVIDATSYGSLVYIDEQCPSAPAEVGVFWHCTALSPIKAFSTRTGDTTTLPPGSKVHCADKSLMPLEPPEDEGVPDPVTAPLETSDA